MIYCLKYQYFSLIELRKKCLFSLFDIVLQSQQEVVKFANNYHVELSLDKIFHGKLRVSMDLELQTQVAWEVNP